MRLQTIRRRIDALASQYTHDPAFVLVRLEDGTEKEIPLIEYCRAVLDGINMTFVRMTRGGSVDDVTRITEVFDLAAERQKEG